MTARNEGEDTSHVLVDVIKHHELNYKNIKDNTGQIQH